MASHPASEKPVALVTGSRTGLGRAIAEHLVQSGYSVVGCSRGAIEAPIEGDYQHELCDVASEPELVSLIRKISRSKGRLDVLVNNAGTASMNHFLLTSSETLDKLLSINVKGTFVATREAAKVMQRKKFGRIVNLSTVAVPLHLAGEAAYAASKSAVEELTRVLAHELGPFGITVNAVGPTPIMTDLIRGVPEEAIQKIVSRCAIPRLGEPKDVINVIDFFLRPESGYITGQVVYLGGVA
jgi:3-oxoacyl-[acyl-carrier protein] reductase